MERMETLTKPYRWISIEPFRQINGITHRYLQGIHLIGPDFKMGKGVSPRKMTLSAFDFTAFHTNPPIHSSPRSASSSPVLLVLDFHVVPNLAVERLSRNDAVTLS